jgi:hypothetical protein
MAAKTQANASSPVSDAAHEGTEAGDEDYTDDLADETPAASPVLQPDGSFCVDVPGFFAANASVWPSDRPPQDSARPAAFSVSINAYVVTSACNETLTLATVDAGDAELLASTLCDAAVESFLTADVSPRPTCEWLGLTAARDGSEAIVLALRLRVEGCDSFADSPDGLAGRLHSAVTARLSAPIVVLFGATFCTSNTP